MPSSSLALVCSVPLEAAPLRAAFREVTPVVVGRRDATRGRIAGVPVLLLPTGMGKTNAAQGLTAVLETWPVHGVIGFGVAGAYPDSSLGPGDIALASREIYGDEGVETLHGWLSAEGIGIPLLEREGVCRFNEFPLNPHRVEAARRALENAGLRVRVGPFATVSACSGTEARGRELAARFAALCETMEGAALAHVCELYRVPFLELRAVSNLVEDRDLSRWRLHDAADAAARAVHILAREWKAEVK